MADLKAYLIKLHQNLNMLQEREAKYGGNAPLELLNQISDHQEAITLTEQAIVGDISETEWQENLRPLLVSVAPYRAAQNIIVILSQYTLDQGTELGQKVGLKASEIARELLITTLDQLRQNPSGMVIADEFAQDPTTYQKPVEKQLAQAIVSNPTFAVRLKTLLTQYEQAARKHSNAIGTSSQATLHGSGAIAQGPGAIAAGAGGVAVSGNVQGGIHIGRRNVEESEE